MTENENSYAPIKQKEKKFEEQKLIIQQSRLAQIEDNKRRKKLEELINDYSVRQFHCIFIWKKKISNYLLLIINNI